MIALLAGDCLDVLRRLPDGYVQMCVTSPPYYGLRSYLPDGHPGKPLEHGTERDPETYVARLVAVFREVRRVLKGDGSLWLNIGDSYNGGGVGGGTAKGGSLRGSSNRARQGAGRATLKVGALKPKDLLMIPARVALALQADGWYLRSEIVWSKPNPMPESVRDRPTSAHEKVFLFAKAPRYYYDAAAVAEPAMTVGDTRHLRPDRVAEIGTSSGYRHGNDRSKTGKPQAETRNCRNIWTITPKPYPGAHFAVMPQELVSRCILAGSRQGGIVLDPFAGAGTVAVVARDLGRQSVNIELNPAYLALARERLDPPAFALAAE